MYSCAGLNLSKHTRNLHSSMSPPSKVSTVRERTKSDSSMEEKVRAYEAFLNETLRQHLRITLEKRDILYGQINEYLQLKTVIEKLKEDGADSRPLKTKVDLGCNFYVQANVQDPSKIFVSVGFGFFVEFTFDEAVKFIERKVAFLTEKTEGLTQAASDIKAHIKLVLEGLREIQNISAETDKPRRDLFL